MLVSEREYWLQFHAMTTLHTVELPRVGAAGFWLAEQRLKPSARQGPQPRVAGISDRHYYLVRTGLKKFVEPITD
jgi:hypothetical protein